MGEEKEEIFVKYLILAISLLDMNEWTLDNTDIHTYNQASRQRDKQTNTKTDRQTIKQTERHTQTVPRYQDI